MFSHCFSSVIYAYTILCGIKKGIQSFKRRHIPLQNIYRTCFVFNTEVYTATYIIKQIIILCVNCAECCFVYGFVHDLISLCSPEPGCLSTGINDSGKQLHFVYSCITQNFCYLHFRFIYQNTVALL